MNTDDYNFNYYVYPSTTPKKVFRVVLSITWKKRSGEILRKNFVGSGVTPVSARRMAQERQMLAGWNREKLEEHFLFAGYNEEYGVPVEDTAN